MANPPGQGTQQPKPIDKLDSIDHLKKINFGKSVPKHSLLLLHWFANTIKIDDNGIWLTFDPKRQYGSHDYDNHEVLLPQGHRYYTVGDLNRDHHELPAYMFYELRGDVGKNVDRIIFSVNENGEGKGAGSMIDQVYITQRKINEHQTTAHDRENTYLVSTNLLRQIRRFSEIEQPQSLWILNTEFESNADDFQLLGFSETWNFPHLGLLLFTVTQKTEVFHKRSRCLLAAHTARSPSRQTAPGFAVSIPENGHKQGDSQGSGISARALQDQRDEIKLEVMTGTDGKARIIWSNIPTHHKNQDAMVVLFMNNEDQKASKTYEFIRDRETGSYDTSVPLNEGLQARLHNVKKWPFLWKGVGQEICRGTEFKNPEPVNITGYEASLQLFVKDGTACARLYVKKSFSEWKSEFNESWVGFYISADKTTNQYKWWQWQWQWATKFKPSHDTEDSSYDVYEYVSGTAIAQGVQARFMLRDEEVKACTPSWK